ncbi:MAG: hypothetical protein LC802_17780 [Acidobacteria bacterium]|nr:hypothetical protein [Acidobacteriota bacterium]
MSVSAETKKLWRTIGIFAVVGILVLIPLMWLALRLRDDAYRRRVIAANEAETLSALEGIAAAQQLYLQNYSQYGTFKQLIEAGVFRAPLEGDSLVADGYSFKLKVTPKADGQTPSFSVNADPLASGERDATGSRHFYLDSNIVGIRVNEERPASAGDPPRQTVSDY